MHNIENHVLYEVIKKLFMQVCMHRQEDMQCALDNILCKDEI